MSLQHRLPDQVVRADPWTFYCAVCSETMRIKTLAPSQGGMKTRTYGWQQTPRYIVRDRDCVYGDVVIQRLRAMGIRDGPISPRSPWQNGYSERLIGSIRRDCLDHVVVFGERHLRHLLNSYQEYYNEARTHLSLHKDAPIPRAVQTVGRTLAMPVLGGLHHQYFRA